LIVKDIVLRVDGIGAPAEKAVDGALAKRRQIIRECPAIEQ
jgi:hypothetical protein